MQKNKKKRKSLNSMKFAKRAMVDSKERRESQKEFWDESRSGTPLKLQGISFMEFTQLGLSKFHHPEIHGRPHVSCVQRGVGCAVHARRQWVRN